MDLLNAIKNIRFWNQVSYSRKAVYKREAYNKNKRIICPFCEEYYLVSVYIKFQPGGGICGNTKWITIGKICPKCFRFFPRDELLQEKDESRGK